MRLPQQGGSWATEIATKSKGRRREEGKEGRKERKGGRKAINSYCEHFNEGTSAASRVIEITTERKYSWASSKSSSNHSQCNTESGSSTSCSQSCKCLTIRIFCREERSQEQGPEGAEGNRICDYLYKRACSGGWAAKGEEWGKAAEEVREEGKGGRKTPDRDGENIDKVILNVYY